MALGVGSPNSAVGYWFGCLPGLLKPVLLAGRRERHSPLHPALISIPAWGRKAQISALLRLVLLADEAGWLSPARWEKRNTWWGNNDHRQHLLWGPSCWQFPTCHKFAPRLIVPPVFPCCWLWTLTYASCKVHICALPSQNSQQSCCFQWVGLVFLRNLVSSTL